MPKYGRGLNREVVGAVNSGAVSEPFDISSIASFAVQKGWNVPRTYLNVALANGASAQHSQTYKKYFYSVGSGSYKLLSTYRGKAWK